MKQYSTRCFPFQNMLINYSLTEMWQMVNKRAASSLCRKMDYPILSWPFNTYLLIKYDEHVLFGLHQGDGRSLLNGRHGVLHGVQACGSQLPQVAVSDSPMTHACVKYSHLQCPILNDARVRQAMLLEKAVAKAVGQCEYVVGRPTPTPSIQPMHYAKLEICYRAHTP